MEQVPLQTSVLGVQSGYVFFSATNACNYHLSRFLGITHFLYETRKEGT